MEISTMKHNEKYLKPFWKNLEDRCLGFLRQGQSILQGKEVFKDQSWKDSQQRAEAFHSGGCLFTGRHIVSGVIATKGHLLVCFEESCVKGIGVHPLIFDDIKGTWKYNLWHSQTLPNSHHSSFCKSRDELLKDCVNYFILLREKDTNIISMRTMICHSWRVRDDLGRLRLPLPLKNVLLMT